MVEHEPYPCQLRSPDGSFGVVCQFDGLRVAGPTRDFVRGKLKAKLEEKCMISVQVVEKPGGELSFLKRTHVLQEDGRMAIQTHRKHVTQMTQMCSLLKINGRMQSKKSLGHADMHKEDNKELAPNACATLRTCVGIDVPGKPSPSLSTRCATS